MAFKRFENAGRSYTSQLSIWSRGQMGLNNDALKEFGVKKDKDTWYVIAFYDEEMKRIGFQFTQDKTEKGILKISFRAGGATLSTKSFLDYNKIDYSENRKYDIKFDEKEKKYVVQL